MDTSTIEAAGPALKPTTSRLRASTYNITIPCGEKSLLLNGRTGALDEVVPRVGQALQAWNRKGPAEDLEPRTLQELARRGYLTEMTEEEEVAYFKRLSGILHDFIAATSCSFFFIPSYECQLRCPYCFELSLYNNGMPFMERKMSPAMIDLAYEAIGKMIKPGARFKKIGLFGGEPLCQANVPTVKYILRRGAEQGFRFFAITNAVDLPLYREHLGTEPGKINRIQVSFDGGPAAHNCRRIHADKSGTFDQIAASVDMALDTGITVTARVNLDRVNLSTVGELTAIFAKKGWLGRPNFNPYAAAVHAAEHTKPGSDAQTERHEHTCFSSNFQMSKALDRAQPGEGFKLSYPDKGVGKMIRDALDKTTKRLPFNPTYCGANNGMVMFDPYGDLYACWDVVGDKNDRVGRYVPELQIDATASQPWRGRDVSSVEQCSQCAYAMFCGGGCQFLSRLMKGSFFESYCDGYQGSFRRFATEAYEAYLARKAVPETGKGGCE